METFIKDIKFGFRTLARKPEITFLAILALGLGIGASTAIFTVVNTVLLRPLPFANGSRLVMVWENNRSRSRERNVVNPANFLDWHEQNHVFQDMAAFYGTTANLTGLGDPEEISGMATTPNLFEVLGEHALVGRTFTRDDAEQGRDNVVILSYGFWQSHFGGDPNAVGKTLVLSGQTITVVGVMPAGFEFFVKENSLVKKKPEFWLPLVFTADSRQRSGRYLSSIALLKPGVTFATAKSEMDALGARLSEQYADFNKNWGITLVPLQDQFSGELRRPLMILLGAVGFVLLIAGANVSNLMLARFVSRQREFAIRAALGAGRLSILRQLLTESLLLAGAACLVGLLLARWGVDALMALSPRDLVISTPRIDLEVLGFTAGLTILITLVLGFLPALEAYSINANESLKEGRRGTTSARGHRVLNSFVITQVALSLMLLIGSGLTIKSLMRLQSVDPGFDPDNLITVSIALPTSAYQQPQQRISFFQQLLTRVRELPGVVSAGAASAPPFAGLGAATGFDIEGQPILPKAQKRTTDVRVVDPQYFLTMKIPMISGRTFTDREVTQASHVVIVSQAMARLHFPNENPLGKHITVYMTSRNEPCEIIGVVGDVKSQALDVDTRSMVYWPHAELPYSALTLVVRSNTDPAAVTSAIQREVRALDKNQPISEMHSMKELLADSISRSRFATTLLSIFAAIAVILATIGIYGVMAYAVTQRTNEIGIRIALGASRREVLTLILRRGLAMTTIGVATGLLGSLAITRVLSNLLFGVSATDPITFVGVAMGLIAVAIVATCIPALRATRIDPLVALRYE